MTEPSPLEAFIAQETYLFNDHLKTVTKSFEENGELPRSLFKQVSIRGLLKAGGKRKTGEKRKPSAFNLFVKEKLAEMKENGVQSDHTKRFSDAVGLWKALSEDQKKTYAEKCGIDAVPADGKDTSDSDSEEEREKKKKKKKDKKSKD